MLISTSSEYGRITLDTQRIASNVRDEQTKMSEGLQVLSGEIKALRQSSSPMGHSTQHGHPSQPAPSAASTTSTVKRECSSTCTCSCHRIGGLTAQGRLSSLLGSLLIQHNAVPAFQGPACDDQACNSRSQCLIRLCYLFPPWFLARAVDFTLFWPGWSGLTGVGAKLHYQVPRVLHSHPLWGAIQNNSIEWIEKKLKHKEILPTDVNEWGMSLAHVSKIVSPPFPGDIVDCLADLMPDGCTSCSV